MLLYWFQFLFPSLTTIIIVVYVICSRPSIQSSKDTNSFATIAAQAVLSFVFIIYVFVLDIVAVAVRNQTPEYYSDMYSKPLFDYPGVLLVWDILALCAYAILVVLVVALDHNKNSFSLTLVEVGVVPILCIASHAHYIVIAWITDPFYATSIGMYYGVCYIIHLLLFKQTYKRVYHYTTKRKAMGAAIAVFLIALVYQLLITVFIAFVPTNNAIENTPSRLFIAIQSVGALLIGYLAYQTIVGKDSLSIITGAIRKVIKMQPTFYTGSTEWKRLENEEKFAEILQHAFKTNVGSDGTSSPTTTPGKITSTTTSSPSTSQNMPFTITPV